MPQTSTEIFELKNNLGLSLILTNYGARITDIRVPLSEGAYDSIVLGFEDVEKYKNNTAYLGATVGRCANRIANGVFSLNKEYTLEKNNGENHLHGGVQALDTKLWKSELSETEEEHCLCFSYLSPAMENNYPGDLEIKISYRLDKNSNRITIDYFAKTNQDTLVNLCNHSYFNLSGDFTKTILDHELKINADYFTPINEKMIPTGEIKSVKNTAFDFRNYKQIAQDFMCKDKGQLEIGKGYDHNFVLNGEEKDLKLAAELYNEKSNRRLKLYCTQPGLQLYTGNYLFVSSTEESCRFGDHTGLCLETQFFPDAINHENFKSPVLRTGETYKEQNVFILEL